MSAILLPNQLAGGRVQVRVAWGANRTADPATWTYSDITTDVDQASGRAITITIGRANEAPVAQPANCSLRLKNTTGAYTPFNPAGSNFPNVMLGTPIQVRVSLDGGSTWTVRFQGEASTWSPGWDAQGKYAYVALTASGTTRRLGQGAKPLRSALYRQITKDATAPLAYWSLEEGINATSFANGVTGGAPLPFVANGGLLSTIDGPPGSAPLIDKFNLGEYPPDDTFLPIPAGADSFHSAECAAYVEAGSSPTAGSDLWMLNWTTSGTFGTWHGALATSGSGVIVYYVDSSGVIQTALTYTAAANLFDSKWHHYRLTFSQSGGNSTITVYVDGTSVTSTVIAMTQGHITGVMPFVNPNTRGAMRWSTGHLAFYGQTPPDNMPAFHGHLGETASDRIDRLCAEEGITLDRIGSSDVLMGAQGVDTLMNLLRDCEATDFGYLLDGLGPGLTYVCRSSLYNEAAQVTINANSGQVPATPGPQPTHDDQKIRNQITVNRTKGSSIVAEEINGSLGTNVIGAFAYSSNVNTSDDTPLQGMAQWLLHLGTAEGMRYPQTPLDLAAAPELASSWVSTIPTDRIDVTNLSSQLIQHPPDTVSLLVEGWTEVINSRTWRATANCSPFRPWEVFEIEDDRLGRIETDGSTLHQNYNAGAISLLVDSSGGLWSTTAAPFDVEIRGWRIHVTAVSGGSSPQTFTVTATLGDLGGGNPVTLYRAGVIAL